MSIRVTLYAEGAGETSSGFRLPSQPGAPLEDDELGPAHRLLRRALSVARRVPEPAVRFLAPLRDPRGRPLAGSDLQHGPTLQQLLTAHELQSPEAGHVPARPDLVVVLVDQDEEPERRTRIEAAIGGFGTPSVVWVAVQEFEAWLIADHGAVTRVLGPRCADPGPPEALPRRGAKELLAEWSAGSDSREVRMTLAQVCDLDRVASRCPSFARARSELLAR